MLGLSWLDLILNFVKFDEFFVSLIIIVSHDLRLMIFWVLLRFIIFILVLKNISRLLFHHRLIYFRRFQFLNILLLTNTLDLLNVLFQLNNFQLLLLNNQFFVFYCLVSLCQQSCCFFAFDLLFVELILELSCLSLSFCKPCF